MEFKYAETSSISSPNLTTQKITIKSNAKAFRLILGQIYPDIIKAIVRELFTNAWDSQKVAGTLSTPIEIHAPNKYEPYFSIRDYGVGMTEEIISNIFSKIFESTKDSSNEEAGMFGMGSKSPLGYTDAYSLISYIDGTMLYYDIHLSSDGTPVISLKVKEKTEEPNGVHIQIGVKYEDIAHFIEMIEHFILGSNTPVKLNGEKFADIYKVTASGTDWQLVDHKSINGLHIRMGCVLYKIRKEFYNNMSSLIDVPLILDFPIGTFDVTGSREDILYNEDAKLSLNNSINHVNFEIVSILLKDIKNKKTYKEAYSYYHNLKSHIRKLLPIGLTWRGRKLPYPSTSSNKLFHNLDIYYIKKQSIYKCRDINFIESDNSCIGYIASPDMKRKTSKIRAFIKQRGYHHSSTLVVEGDPNSFSMKKLMARTGIKNLVDISKVEIQKVQRSPVNRKPKNFVYSWNNEVTTEFTEKTFSKYYIVKGRSSLDNYLIQRACNFLIPKNKKHIAQLNKGSMHLVKEYGLIDLVEEYRNCLNKVKFTKDDVHQLMILNNRYRTGVIDKCILECIQEINPKARGALLGIHYDHITEKSVSYKDIHESKKYYENLISWYKNKIPLAYFAEPEKVNLNANKFKDQLRKEMEIL